ncbi:MAG TPA: class I SAM-dependent methyltransferase, partial [Chitinophagaceae bacterium]|nr:class I SAM-dependent methyltransferase [Chitinophagaceae bacterium]
KFNESKDIQARLQQIALEETVAYITRHMQSVPAVSSAFAVYDFVLPRVSVADGLYCEFGVWKGNSINYMARKVDREFHGFDSFTGLPEFWRGGYGKGAFSLDGALPPVEKNVRLHKGWFEETLPPFLRQYPGPIALLHVDSDLYSSAKTIFSYLKERITEGTIIVFDEYFNFPFWQNQEYKAFREFLAETGWGYDYLCYNQCHEQVAVQIRKGTGGRPAEEGIG